MSCCSSTSAPTPTAGTQIGGGSNWWYHPVWWMVGTFLPWMGAWILANQPTRNGRISVAGRASAPRSRSPCWSAVVAVLIGFPGARWNLPTFGGGVPSRARPRHGPLGAGEAPHLRRCAGFACSSASSAGCSRHSWRGQLRFSGPWRARSSPCAWRIRCGDWRSRRCCGALAGFAALIAWLDYLRRSPEVREVLAVTEDGTPDTTELRSPEHADAEVRSP